MESLADAMKQLQERIKVYQTSPAVGSVVSTKEKQYDCPKCKDEEGFIIRQEDGNEVWRWCECRENKIVNRLFQASQITEEFQKKSLINFELKGRPQVVWEAYDAALEYLENYTEIHNTRKNSIALLGVPGVGKTHLLMAISNELMRNGVGVLYFPWVEGFNDLKNDFDNMEQKVHRMQNISVLYIDDLFKGRKKPTEFQVEQLFAIVNYRYLNNKPILLSSEWDFNQICGFDMGIGSRLYEMCKDYAVELKGGLELNYRLAEV